MKEHNDIKRLSRLTAILTLLQTKRLLTATELAAKFAVSNRTIYRDIKALEQAGVPMITDEGKGYSLMEGYRIPPIMFTETEANALITAEKFMCNNKDASLANEYTAAIQKIKAVLRYHTQDKAHLLANRMEIRYNQEQERTSHFLAAIQLALTNFSLLAIAYLAQDKHETTSRHIEPFALYYTRHNWILIAYCRLRNDFRAFRLDRIKQLYTLTEKFEPHTLSLQDYLAQCREKYPEHP